MREVVKIYMQPAFLICVALLAIAGGGMSFAVKKFEMHLKKEPLPLKKSLELLDEKDLSSYKVIAKKKIHNKEVVEALGTKQYIQWVLEQCRHNKSRAAEALGINRVSLYRKLKKSQITE